MNWLYTILATLGIIAVEFIYSIIVQSELRDNYNFGLSLLVKMLACGITFVIGWIIYLIVQWFYLVFNERYILWLVGVSAYIIINYFYGLWLTQRPIAKSKRKKK